MTQLEVSIGYNIVVRDEKLLASLYESLKPEIMNLPSDCRGDVRIVDHILALEFSCRSISKLQALNNSFIGVLSMLLELVGDTTHERETASTRDPATRDTVSNSQRPLREDRG